MLSITGSSISTAVSTPSSGTSISVRSTPSSGTSISVRSTPSTKPAAKTAAT
ncbi:hypothetical protein [Rhodoferax sp.]